MVQIFLKSDIKYPSGAVRLGHLDKYLSRDQIVREPHLKSHFRGLNQLSGILPRSIKSFSLSMTKARISVPILHAKGSSHYQFFLDLSLEDFDRSIGI